MLDTHNPDLDRQLASHICALYSGENYKPSDAKNKTAPLEKDFMMQYISYARRTCEPQLTEEAVNEMISTYLQLRQSGKSGSVNSHSTEHSS